MEFRLTIELGNETMSTRDNIVDALRDAAKRIEEEGPFNDPAGIDHTIIRDTNGNTVGSFVVVTTTNA